MTINLLHFHIVSCGNLQLLWDDMYVSPWDCDDVTQSAYMFLYGYEGNCFHHWQVGYPMRSWYQSDFQWRGLDSICRMWLSGFTIAYKGFVTEASFTTITLVQIWCPHAGPWPPLKHGHAQIRGMSVSDTDVSDTCQTRTRARHVSDTFWPCSTWVNEFDSLTRSKRVWLVGHGQPVSWTRLGHVLDTTQL